VSRRLLVLGWHNVASCPSSPSAGDTAIEGFARQVALLGRVANVVPLGPALARLSSGSGLPRRAVAITFDDGYRDNLELAVPVLERLGLPATFFLVPGLLSREMDAWWERTGWAVSGATVARGSWQGESLPDDARGRHHFTLRLNERLKALTRAERDRAVGRLAAHMRPVEPFPEDLFLDWDGARRLAARGFEIGSHTQFHPILSRESPAEQVRDLAESRRLLEHGLDIPIGVLAYPNGSARDYDAHTRAAARAAGYSHAVTTLWGWNHARTPPLEIRRMLVAPRKGVQGLARALGSGLPGVGSRLEA
jgi:peptidoglycan/xylan/chitin deacetylase (PgdA/CDA1 family)